jgi:hypothetical protein
MRAVWVLGLLLSVFVGCYVYWVTLRVDNLKVGLHNQENLCLF